MRLIRTVTIPLLPLGWLLQMSAAADLIALAPFPLWIDRPLPRPTIRTPPPTRTADVRSERAA
jgi:hypothetical protein